MYVSYVLVYIFNGLIIVLYFLGFSSFFFTKERLTKSFDSHPAIFTTPLAYLLLIVSYLFSFVLTVCDGDETTHIESVSRPRP